MTSKPPAKKKTSAAGKPFDVDCKLHYELPATTDFVFQVHALDGMDQSVESESLHITPGSTRRRVFEDPYVNQRFLRVQADAGPFRLHYKAHVRVHRPPANKQAKEHLVEELPDEVLHHLMPTRYCESDLLGPATLKLFGHLKPGWSRVQAVCDWIRRNVEYKLGSSNSTTTACNVFLQRAGVCRDFAHLGVTFCRALNIPARLAVGYSIFDTPPPDFHAMFEAYIGGRWQLFDPTRMSPPEEMVRIAVGRDAKDVAFATIFGPAFCRLIMPCVKPG